MEGINVKDKIRCGLIGCGVIAGTHAEAVHQNPDVAELVACFDTVEERAKEFAGKNGDIAAYTTLEDILAHPGLDAILVCVPSGLHAPIVVAAAEKGIHSLVEKPLDINKEGLNAMERAAEKTGVTVAGVFQRRTWENVIAAREAVQSGALGKMALGMAEMKAFRSQAYYDNDAWRGTWAIDGGGALMNQGIHALDMLIFMMGRVTSVTAQMEARTHTIEVEDTLTALLRFENGALGTLVAATSITPDYPIKHDLHGEKGSITIIERQPIQWNVPDVPEPAPFTEDINPYQIGHTRLLRDFAEALLTGREPLVPVKEARYSVDLILAIYESARTGKTVNLA